MHHLDKETTGMRLISIVVCIFACSCVSHDRALPATFEGQLATDSATLVGWLDTRGELRLFATKSAMKSQARFPYCVSGIMKNLPARDLRIYDGQLVMAQGKVFQFSKLPKEVQGYPLARHILGGAIITNWCFGDRVMLFDSIKKL